MNLVLIGYRGTGKTAIGRALAAELRMPYVGLDAEIVRRAGQSIPEIVAASGWDGFRDIEAAVTREAAAGDGRVLDTGGGVILREANVARLRANGMVFWLQATVTDIARRIGGDNQRPSLTGSRSFTDEVEEVLAVRLPKYRAASDATVDTSVLSVEQAVARIAAQFRARLVAGA